MFSAIKKDTMEEIIILDEKWKVNIELLRTYGHTGDMICEECKQPVRIRAGKIRRRHFSHISKGNCNKNSDSHELLSARALLYEYLKSKYGDGLKIEIPLRHPRIKKTIDCLATGSHGKVAYWIVEKNLREQLRWDIKENLEKEVDYIVWVVLDRLRKERDGSDNEFILSTTERSILTESIYDLDKNKFGFRVGETIHYLDVKNEILRTYRNSILIHEPHTFNGIEKKSRLTELLIHPRTGEFVHPGEHDEYLEDIRLKKEQEERQAELLKKEQEHEREVSRIRKLKISSEIADRNEENANGLLVTNRHENTDPDSDDTNDDIKSEALSGPFDDRETPVCVFCLVKTSEWWSYNGVDNTCKCNECAKKGIDSEEDIMKLERENT